MTGPGKLPASPAAAATVRLRRTRRTTVLLYDHRPAPFPLVLRRRTYGIRAAGERLAEAWREGA
ncbi:hypothetical protein J2X64_000337 [Phycicoccus sp. 3266]|nr:hypothetical protein [Phycicoccus sp. 3266]